VLSSLLFSGVRNRRQALRSLRFSSIFCFIWIGQSRVVSISVYSGVAFQPAHCIVSLKNLTAASIFSSVLRGTFRVSFSLTRCRKSSQFVYLLLKHGCFSWFLVCVVSVAKTGE
jgi:hypothetical protein